MTSTTRHVVEIAINNSNSKEEEEEEEDRTTALSWTSSTASLSPDHILYLNATTVTTAEPTTDGTTTNHTISHSTNRTMAPTGTKIPPAADATLFAYPEDDEGEPLVDEETMLQLEVAAAAQSTYHHHTNNNNMRDNDDDMDDTHHPNNPVMLDDCDGDETLQLLLPSSSLSSLSLDPFRYRHPLWSSAEPNSNDNHNNPTNQQTNDECVPLSWHRHGRHPSTIAEEGLFDSTTLLSPFKSAPSPLLLPNTTSAMGILPQSNTAAVASPADARASVQRPRLESTNEQEQQHRLLTPPSSPLRRSGQSSSRGDLNACTGTNRNQHSPVHSRPLSRGNTTHATAEDPLAFYPMFTATRCVKYISCRVLPRQHIPYAGAATWMGFWAMLFVTCANYVLTPMRDAMALQVGVQHIPQLTLASTLLAVVSSVPMGWLFEAPDPSRRRLWKRMGLTRGETQGTSLALFYRIFAWIVIAYAVGFTGLEWFRSATRFLVPSSSSSVSTNHRSTAETNSDHAVGIVSWTAIWSSLGPIMFIAFFLIVHLMKLHCLSLVWGVTTEAMEYEDVARQQHQKTMGHSSNSQAPEVPQMESQKMRLKRLSLVGFGGTLGGIIGSFLASAMAQILHVPGLLVLAAVLLEISAELSIEMGRIMKKHWEEQQQLFQSTNDLASLDPSMQRSTSLGSMKRISSGNSLSRVKSSSDLDGSNLAKRASSGNLSSMTSSMAADTETLNADSFSQRMMRGITTILRSRLLMAIFTYNALYASTTVLLSFQRAALIAGRTQNMSTASVQADTAFLAKINMASSAAIFALQASGVGASVAHQCGCRGTLALMPMVRLLGVVALAWWHRISGGQAPNLLVFLVADECCKIMNLAVAKPVRESLWRGLSNEARYEAKPIVDTLANRWGGGSAAFLVSFVDKTLDLFGGPAIDSTVTRTVLGFPPVLLLCVVISAWWAAVSADLGHIRMKIDLELKKRQ